MDTHGMTTDEYKEKYNLPIKSQKLCDAVKGENNPGYQHGGKLSPFSKNFVNYQGDDKIQELFDKATKTRIENGNVPTSIEYFLKKSNGDMELARKMQTERQTTFSLDICIQRHGEEQGRRVWEERQNKWLETIKNSDSFKSGAFHAKKSSTANFRTLMENIGIPGTFYVLQYNDSAIKIGVTTYSTCLHRYSPSALKGKTVIAEIPFKSMHIAMMIEQVLKVKYNYATIEGEYGYDFGWTEILHNVPAQQIIDDVNVLASDQTLLESEFERVQ
jgi:hypothetical protein